MKSMTLLVASLVVLGATAGSRGDKFAPPSPRIYASTWGTHGFKMLPPDLRAGGPATGILFSLDKDGKEKPVWEEKLVNIPMRVLISEDGKHVVTIDTYASMGYKHALVVYGEKGKVVADLRLEDLLTEKEITDHIPRTASSRHWAGKADFAFDLNRKDVVVTMKWGPVIKVNLATGKVERS